MRTRSHRAPSSGRRTRRRTTWATHQSTENFAAANDLHTIDLLDQYKTAGGGVVGITIARTILRLTPTYAVAAGDRLNLGVIRGQDSDIGTNIAGAPSPSSKFYEDWAWLEQYDAANQTGAGPNFNTGGGLVIALDIRSKRKLPELQMSWNLSLHSSVIANAWQLFARTLIFLP
jgi:hypothetical protein